MNENREALVIKMRLSKIRKDLRMLRDDGIIDQMTYRDFLFLASNATTADQLDQLTEDLFEIRNLRREERDSFEE